MQEIKQSEAKTKRLSIKCNTCGNEVYFWRDSGRLKCQICGDYVDYLI
ncbi:MAG: hypothetical protein ACLFVI_01930 [Archaeoglobaceae archaeon]